MKYRLKLGRSVWLCLFIGFVLSPLGCRGSQTVSERSLRVGAILDLTGPAASFGQMQLQGLEMARDALNAQKPCGLGVELNVQDSRLETPLALTAATRFASDPSLMAVVSITGSSMALATAPVFGRHQLPVIDSLSSAAALTEAGGPYYYRLQPSDTYAGGYLVQWARQRQYKRVATLYADSDWGVGLRDAIRAAANPGEIVLEEPVRRGDLDARALVARVRSHAPDAILLVAHPQEAGRFVRQLREARVDTPVLGSDSLSTDEFKAIAGSAVDGVRYCLTGMPSSAQLSEFEQQFSARHRGSPTINSVKPYDALRLAYEAVCTQGLSRQGIKTYLDSGFAYQGVGGVVKLDKNGDVLEPTYERFIYKSRTASRDSE